jgi:hypothetical protein
MGKGRNWSPEERSTLARAYANATNDGEKGADQQFQAYAGTIYENVRKMAPASAQAQGTYHFRGVDAMYKYFRDSIAKDVQHFNASKRIVRVSNPTGVTEEEKFCMAVAIHLKLAKKMEYTHKDFDITRWPNYLAYYVLKDLPKFRDQNASTTLEDDGGKYDSDDNDDPTMEKKTRRTISLPTLPVPSILVATTTRRRRRRRQPFLLVLATVKRRIAPVVVPLDKRQPRQPSVWTRIQKRGLKSSTRFTCS